MSSLAVAGAIALVAPMAPCDLENIEATLLSNSTIAAEVKRSKEQCKQDTGVDIFAITELTRLRRNSSKVTKAATFLSISSMATPMSIRNALSWSMAPRKSMAD